MFELVQVEDMVRIEAHDFAKPFVETLTAAVNAKFANKIVMDCGLAICAFDILSVGDALLFPGIAAQHVQATFRLLVFRPALGELIEGTASHISPEGVRVSLGFFDDVFVPTSLMPRGARFEEADNAWTMLVPTAEGDLFLEENDKVRVRVAAVVFNKYNTLADRPPAPGPGPGPGPTGTGAVGQSFGGKAGSMGQIPATGAAVPGLVNPAVVAGAGTGLAQPAVRSFEPPQALPAMEVKASFKEDGLGALVWWF